MRKIIVAGLFVVLLLANAAFAQNVSEAVKAVTKDFVYLGTEFKSGINVYISQRLEKEYGRTSFNATIQDFIFRVVVDAKKSGSFTPKFYRQDVLLRKGITRYVVPGKQEFEITFPPGRGCDLILLD